jgi:hypothetical protein
MELRPQEDLESRWKAGFIYQCATLMRWPEARAKESKMVIGVIGDDHVRSILGRDLAGKKAGDRPISVVATSASEVRNCHIVYVGRSASASADAVIAQAKGAGVLTIGDSEAGFMVQFIVVKDRVRITADQGLLKQAGIRPTAEIFRILK